jgi:hypothetical protein
MYGGAEATDAAWRDGVAVRGGGPGPAGSCVGVLPVPTWAFRRLGPDRTDR